MQLKLKLTVAAAMAAACGLAAAQDRWSRSVTSPRSRGAQAHYGKDNENGVRMAIEDLNAKGVTIGGKKVKFELHGRRRRGRSRSRARPPRRSCATPRSPAWSAT